MEAISHAGICVGILAKDGIVLAVEKKITSKLLENISSEKMYKVRCPACTVFLSEPLLSPVFGRLHRISNLSVSSAAVPAPAWRVSPGHTSIRTLTRALFTLPRPPSPLHLGQSL